jgi:hypothetical protein
MERSGIDSRAELIDALRTRLSDAPWAQAAWLGGSDANGRTDRWSDIDLVTIVDDDAVEQAFGAARAAVETVAPIGLELRLPQPTWHGHDQVFWQLEGVPDWCMIDLVVIRAGSTSPRFLEVERHGTPLVLFDRGGLVIPAHLDRSAHGRAIHDRLAALPTRFRLLQHLVRKAVWRGDPAEAADRYLTYTLRPLVELLRIRHCPDRFDFGMRYLRDDLPAHHWREIEALSLPGSLEAVLAAQARAEASFERELAAIAAGR